MSCRAGCRGSSGPVRTEAHRLGTESPRSQIGKWGSPASRSIGPGSFFLYSVANVCAIIPPQQQQRRVVARRRGRGEGSIFQRKDGRWTAIIEAGYKTVAGSDGK